MNVNSDVRAGRLNLVGHYSNLSHVFTIVGAQNPLRAQYRGEVRDDNGRVWHQFFVPALEMLVFGSRVDVACNVYLAEGAL